jgi:hypothetical protein
MIQVIFALSMKYTKAVFTGSAVVPSWDIQFEIQWEYPTE